jgi:murein biosynthesis integral membrane protein MurJ
MLGAAGLLTVVTLLGLVAGLGREWLLVASWGAGARTDGFLIALFIPEAVRMILAGGVLSSAGMALWQSRSDADRLSWLGQLTVGLAALGISLSLLFVLGAPWWISLIGPGLSEAARPATQGALAVMAWALPALILQALWSVPLQAQARFLLPGLASLVYNLPPVLWLAWHRSHATELDVAWAFVAGAIASACLMVPAVRRLGLGVAHLRWHGAPLRELGARAAPLLGSAVTGQALMLLERMVASYLGEGVVTVLNLARKLVNLPLVALMSINQVLLGLMSRGSDGERLPLLRQGLALNTLVTTPAAVGLLLSAQAIVLLLFPKVQGTAILAPLLGWYAAALVIAGWNTLLARYNHAAGDTRLPFVCETAGNLIQAVTLPLLAWLLGAQGIAIALLLGVLVNGALMLHFNALWRQVRLSKLVLAGSIPLGLSAAVLLPVWPSEPLYRLLASTAAGAACLITMAVWLKPWRPQPT